uniref:Protein kinase domain-containing protein n=1 Tax=Scylla olivacea TaxID=85551 RepID=A0A0P4WB83_SCYOL
MKFPGWSRALLHEAQVLQVLAGVAGVPRLYGVTQTAPHVLVMSRCPGISVVELRRRGEVRLCLTALLHLCDIVSAMHERRVIHRDLHGGNILVSSKDTDAGVDVWVVDFGEAVMCAGGEALKVDEAQVMMLVRDTLRGVRQDSDRDIFRRRRNALTNLTNNSLGLHQISSMIRTVLRGTHSGTGAIQSPTL